MSVVMGRQGMVETGEMSPEIAMLSVAESEMVAREEAGRLAVAPLRLEVGTGGGKLPRLHALAVAAAKEII